MERQSSSHMPKKTEKKKIIDPCPICNDELYLSEEFTQRIGLLGDFDDVVGWLCPHCKSEFDADNHLTKFLGENGLRGEA